MVKSTFDVLLVGEGVAAISAAIRIMQFTSKPLSLVAIERFPQRRNGGLAYASPGTAWHDVYNIQAGRMSIFREDVDDFLRWANDEADRQNWHPDWADTTFTVSGPAPRRIYTDYMADRLDQALAQAPKGTTYEESVGEVVDVVPGKKSGHQSVIVRVEDGTGDMVDRTLLARQVVLATGTEFRRLPFTEQCYDHSAFIRLQYSADGFARMQKVGKKDTVLIIGSALSGFDAAITLYRDLGHRGPIRMLSRHGYVPHVYPDDHQHAVIQVRRPPLLDKPYEGRDQLVCDIYDEWTHLCGWLKAVHPEIPESIYGERILKAWEPYVAELVGIVPAPDVKYLLDHYNALISNLRVAAMPYARRALAKADLAVIAGHIQTIEPKANGGFKVKYTTDDGENSIDADMVIANLNRETDYAKVHNPLWRSLIDRRRLATPNRATGRGVEVGPFGELISPEGRVATGLSAIGLPREGDEIARHGRLGPFPFNVAALKNHSIGTAIRTVAVLEGVLRAGDAAAPADREALIKSYVSKDNTDAFRTKFEKAADLQIRWLSERTRAGKRPIAKRADRAKAGLAEMMTRGRGNADHKMRRLEAALFMATVERMTDVTVTPRALRDRLGLTGEEATSVHAASR